MKRFHRSELGEPHDLAEIRNQIKLFISGIDEMEGILSDIRSNGIFVFIYRNTVDPAALAIHFKEKTFIYIMLLKFRLGALYIYVA